MSRADLSRWPVIGLAARLHNEMLTANSQVEAFGGQRGQSALEFETVSQRVSALSAEIGQTRNSLEAKRDEETACKRHLDGLRAEYATALGKRGSLEAVIAEHGYSTESVRRLFQSGVMNGGLAPVGVLADFLEVESRYEGVVEDFLRDELNYIVVKSWDTANEGLRLLRSDVDGRAKRNQFDGVQTLAGHINLRQSAMRIGGGVPVPWKMFGGGNDSALLRAFNECRDELCY